MSVVEMDAQQALAAPVTNSVVQHGPFQLTNTGVIAVGPVSFEEWTEATEWVQRVNSAVSFWLGDLLEFGERRFGDKYTQAVEATGHAVQTLTNAAYVARHVPIERRREKVSFSHHAEVASLPPDQQEQWLERAETNGLTRAQLRAGIQAAKAVESGTPTEFLVVVTCETAEDQDAVYNEMLMSGRGAKMVARDK